MREQLMSEPEKFAEYLQRLRAGDEQAAADLVRDFEPLIRRQIRVQLRDPGLCRLMDSVDICQSVLASFFVRAASGQFDLTSPEQLLKLLSKMARNKFVGATRRHQAERRDVGRMETMSVEELNPPGREAAPSRVAAGREMLAAVRELLTDEERRLADLRGQGHNWSDVAREVGGSPDGRRIQLTRALDRVTRQLGLDEDDP